MSTNAAHTMKPTSSLAPFESSRRTHSLTKQGKTVFDESDIRVIAGGKCAPAPLHARAIPTSAPQQSTPERLRASLRGVGFNMNARERAFAFGAGVLFAAAALAAAIY